MPNTPRPKRVNYEKIDREDGIYDMMLRVIDRHHNVQLGDARIVLFWRKALRPDPDGRLVLGKLSKCSDMDRELQEYDFRLAINDEAWASFDQNQREALLHHFLCRARRAKNKDGSTKMDEKGRIVYRSRKPDIVEFSEVVEAYGFYTQDLRDFAEKVIAKKKTPLFADVPETPGSNGEAAPGRPGKPRRPSRKKANA